MIYPCLDHFLLRFPDDVGSVGSACGILSGPSFCARQFSSHSLATSPFHRTLNTPHRSLPPTLCQPSFLASQTPNLCCFMTSSTSWFLTSLILRKGKKKTISNLPPYPHLPLFQYTSLLVLLPFILPRIILALSPPRRPSPCIVWRLFSDCPCAGLLLPPL